MDQKIGECNDYLIMIFICNGRSGSNVLNKQRTWWVLINGISSGHAFSFLFLTSYLCDSRAHCAAVFLILLPSKKERIGSTKNSATVTAFLHTDFTGNRWFERSSVFFDFHSPRTVERAHCSSAFSAWIGGSQMQYRSVTRHSALTFPRRNVG